MTTKLQQNKYQNKLGKKSKWRKVLKESRKNRAPKPCVVNFTWNTKTNT